ncbi:PREDICTED: uncharacterized protein LOC109209277 [Nicotiana attenuata]|uniref:Uncharacterized protein n=1 Tax=Nicotiana attenuata TaxID=49451 RepID=A0A314KNS2_NICAT|nr:PREDICTED: uncharacterized protein LOC109209277 [Nicotiana attenuata]OIT30996.1 hypothetical protein A4A49_11675 [Nicotiana attenuata]
MEEEGLRERGSPVVVYLHGLDNEFDWWYCIDVPLTKDPLLTKDDDNSGQPIILPMKKISPVAKLNPVIYGSAGNWAVIGDDIYYAGGSLCVGLSGSIPNEKLVKHSMTQSDPAVWKYLYMYAYDVCVKRWFQSPCLIDQFPSLSSHGHPPPSPILVGLPQDGKFVVFLPEEPEPGLMMMACLKVERSLQSI